jgi:predicted metalloprotease with PDZ domain
MGPTRPITISAVKAAAVAALLAFATLRGQAQTERAQRRTDDPVRYVLSPAVGDRLVRLSVAMTFRGAASSTTEIQLPDDYYGTPRLYEFVRDVRVSNGASITNGARPTARVVTHEPRAEVTLHYTVAFDPARRPGSAYRPSVGPTHFQFLGPQCLARILDEGQLKRRVTLEFADVPPGWTVFSSFGTGSGPHETLASWGDLVETVLGGGLYEHDEFTVHERPVHTFVHGTFKVGAPTLFESVKSIVTYQRRFFDDYDHPPLIVTLTARPRLCAGTSIHNAMVCYVDADNPSATIQLLLAHEMFHQWLPGKGEIDPGTFEDRFDWINEGFTEYFARRLLFEQNLISLDRFVELFNRDLRELARNPHRKMSLSDIEEVQKRGEFTNHHYRLSYLRGSLIALKWNTRILRTTDGKQSLLHCMREIINRADRRGGALPESEFHSLMGRFGVDSRADIERWLERAAPIQPVGNAFGERFHTVLQSVADPGFRRETSERRGVLSGVDEDGPAYAAGLRDGMSLVELADDGRPNAPITVTVRVSGEEHTVNYEPRSRFEVHQYVRWDHANP